MHDWNWLCSPSPHSGWRASPHGWWRGHPAGGREPARRQAHCGGQHCCDCDLLTVDLTFKEIRRRRKFRIFDAGLCLQSPLHRATHSSHVPPLPLTSVHVLQCFLCLLRCLKLHIGVAFGQVRVDAVHGHVNHLDLAVDGEDLLDVFLQRHEAETFRQIHIQGN